MRRRNRIPHRRPGFAPRRGLRSRRLRRGRRCGWRRQSFLGRPGLRGRKRRSRRRFRGGRRRDRLRQRRLGRRRLRLRRRSLRCRRRRNGGRLCPARRRAGLGWRRGSGPGFRLFLRATGSLRTSAVEDHTDGRGRREFLGRRLPVQLQQERPKHGGVEEQRDGGSAGNPATATISTAIPWGQGLVPAAITHAIGTAIPEPSDQGATAAARSATIAGIAASGCPEIIAAMRAVPTRSAPSREAASR
jgi:hypothetical protein